MSPLLRHKAPGGPEPEGQMQTLPGSRGTPPPARLALLLTGSTWGRPSGGFVPPQPLPDRRSAGGSRPGARPAPHTGPSISESRRLPPQDGEGARRGGGRRGAADIRTEGSPAFPTQSAVLFPERVHLAPAMARRTRTHAHTHTRTHTGWLPRALILSEGGVTSLPAPLGSTKILDDLAVS